MADSCKATRNTKTKSWKRYQLPPPKVPSIFIAMACSGKGIPIRIDKFPPDVYPVLAGAALIPKRQRGMSFDDCGRNISKDHRLYSELTVTYWLHKNAPDFDYLGLCDEHRCFLFTDNHRKALAFQKVDVFLPSMRVKLPSVDSYFHPEAIGSLQRRDFVRMLEVLDEKYPDMAARARNIFKKEFRLPSNLLIARVDIFHSYADFLFSVLQTLQKKNEADGIEQKTRSLCIFGELLTTLYFEYHQDEWKIQRINSHMLPST